MNCFFVSLQNFSRSFGVTEVESHSRREEQDSIYDIGKIQKTLWINKSWILPDVIICDFLEPGELRNIPQSLRTTVTEWRYKTISDARNTIIRSLFLFAILLPLYRIRKTWRKIFLRLFSKVFLSVKSAASATWSPWYRNCSNRAHILLFPYSRSCRNKTRQIKIIIEWSIFRCLLLNK